MINSTKVVTESIDSNSYTNCRECEIPSERILSHNGYNEELANRLVALESQLKDGTLIKLETVAKLMVEMFNDCPCNFNDIDEYMCEHGLLDRCNECASIATVGDYTPCWVQYLKVKLKEIAGG